MYHEVTYNELRRRRYRRIRLVVAGVLAAALVWLALTVAGRSAREQGEAAVRTAVVRAALQCCAIEGSYPTSLSVLEERYGLVINEAAYQVRYEWLGDNIPPSVVVVAR